MDIRITGGLSVDGSEPIVIIGPNGVGKTRLGVAIIQTNPNNAERVSALRNVEISDIPMQRLSQASQNVKSNLQQVLTHYWKQSFELQNLLSEILAEDRDCAVAYREQSEQESAKEPDETLINTRLRKVVEIWNRHFPGRKINITYEPVVQRTASGTNSTYPIAQMSEGERTALYLISRVISCTKQVLVIDEPETFFHPLLARNLWNDLEEARPLIRFVYITHDIPFALSRRRAKFVIARSESAAQLLPDTSHIPDDITAQVLGAASFSVTASRLIFCEGKPDSYDFQILSAWHDCPNTAVTSVEGCDAVRECVSVFRGGKVTSGVEAFGYIDRDGWPDNYLESDEGIRPHPVSEIEGFLCIEKIFAAIGLYFDVDEKDLAPRYEKFLSAAKSHFKGMTLNKEILNRAKKRVEIEQRALLNPISPDSDLQKVREKFGSAIPSGGWSDYLSMSFEQEEKRLTASLHGPIEEFLKDFPAKSYYSHAATALNVMPDAIVRTICLALRLEEKQAANDYRLKKLRDALVEEMSSHMWPRRA